MLIVSGGFLAAVITISPNTSAITMSPNVKVNNEEYNRIVESLNAALLDAGRTIVVWHEDDGGVGTKDVHLAYSSNNGTTFSPESIVNSNTTGSQSQPSVATGPDRDVYIVWQDSNDGNRLYLAKSTDGGRTFEEEKRVTNTTFGKEYVPDIAVNGQTVAVVWQDYGSENSIRVWNPDTGALLETLAGHEGAVRSLDYSPDGLKLLSGGEDNRILVWDTGTWSISETLTEHTSRVTSTEWSPNGTQFASGSFDFFTKIWDASDYSVSRSIYYIENVTEVMENPVNKVAWSPDGAKLAIAYSGIEVVPVGGMPKGFPNNEFNLRICNTSDWSNYTVNEDGGDGHTFSLTSVKFSNNSKLLASSAIYNGGEPTLKIWNVTSGALDKEFASLGTVYDVTWSPDDVYLAAALFNGTIYVVNYTNTLEEYWLTDHNGRVNALDWHKLRDELVSGASDPRAIIWNATENVPIQNLTGHKNSVYAVEWSSTGDRVLTAGGNSEDAAWNEIQIYYAVSTDGGGNFSEPAVICDTLDGEKRGPKVAIAPDNTISIVWTDQRNGADDVYFSNSTDLGASFSADLRIDGTAKIENHPQIDVEDDGTAHVVWMKQKNSGEGAKHNIQYANSTDNFAGSRPVSPTPFITNSSQSPDITVVPDGSNIFVTWVDDRDSPGTFRVFLTNSSDGGITWDSYTTVSDEISNQKYSPAIATDKYGQISVVWEDYRDYGTSVYFSDNVVSDLTAPEIISVAPLDGSTNVSIFSAFKIIFSEPMDKNAVWNAFTFTDGTDDYTAADCTVVWSGYGDVVRFIPNTPFQYWTTYTGTLTVPGPEDISGNDLGTGIQWSFSTGDDYDAPVVGQEFRVEFGGDVITVNAAETFTVNYDQVVNISAEIIDYHGVMDEARLYYQGIGNASFTQLAMVEEEPGVSDYYGATIPAQWALGDVEYYIWAIDVRGNSNETPHGQYSVIDGTGPEIEHDVIVEWSVHVPIVVEANITDFGNLTSVKAFYMDYQGLYFDNVSMTRVNATDTYTGTIPAWTNIGRISYYLEAKDESGNGGVTLTNDIAIVDITPPEIVPYEVQTIDNILYPNRKDIFISAKVTDNVEVADVYLYFKAVGGEIWVKRPMSSQNGSDNYSFTIDAPARSGTISYYINATDTSGNLASTVDEQQDNYIDIPVKGYKFDWMPYAIVIAIAFVVAILVSYFNRKKKRPKYKPDGETPPEETDEIPEPPGAQNEMKDASQNED